MDQETRLFCLVNRSRNLWVGHLLANIFIPFVNMPSLTNGLIWWPYTCWPTPPTCWPTRPIISTFGKQRSLVNGSEHIHRENQHPLSFCCFRGQLTRCRRWPGTVYVAMVAAMKLLQRRPLPERPFGPTQCPASYYVVRWLRLDEARDFTSVFWLWCSCGEEG